MSFMETSALKRENIEEVFKKLIKEVYDKNRNMFLRKISLSLNDKEK